jgi:hypothetical protein
MPLKKQKSSSCNLLKQYNIKGQTKGKEKKCTSSVPSSCNKPNKQNKQNNKTIIKYKQLKK